MIHDLLRPRLALFVTMVMLLPCLGCATFTTFAPSDALWMEQHQMTGKELLCRQPIAHGVRWVNLVNAEKAKRVVADDATRKLLEEDNLWTSPPNATASGEVFAASAPLLSARADETKHPILVEWVAHLGGASRPAMAGEVVIDSAAARAADLLFEGKFGAPPPSPARMVGRPQMSDAAYDRMTLEQAKTANAMDRASAGTDLLSSTSFGMLSLLATLNKEQNDSQVLAAQVVIDHTLTKTGALSKDLPPEQLLHIYIVQNGEFDQDARIITDHVKVLAFVTRPASNGLTATRTSAMRTTINNPTPPPGHVPIERSFNMAAYLATDATYELCLAAEMETGSAEPLHASAPGA